MKRKVVAILLMLCSAISLCACDNSTAHKYTITDTFDTVIEVICYTSKADVQKYGACAEQMLREYHKLFDGYRRWAGVNNVCALNESAGQWIEMNDELQALLTFGKEVYVQTEGVVNMMGGAVSSLWKQTEVPPDSDKISKALQHININSLEMKDGKACITDPEARIDVGAFAKGYALQKVADELKSQGFTGIISAVSSVVAVGDKNGTPFVIGLMGADGGVAETLELGEKKALSTSGIDQRYFTYEGKRYHHIIDLATGLPAQSGVRQASVLHTDAGWADALSTAALITGNEDLPDTIIYKTEE